MTISSSTACNSEVDDYLASFSDATRCCTRMRQLGRGLVRVGLALQGNGWRDLEDEPPADWPSWDELLDLKARILGAIERAERTYGCVPSDQRHVLARPEAIAHVGP